MRVIVAGGTGFLGRALVTALRGNGHNVRVLTRRPRSASDVAWSPEGGNAEWTAEIAYAEAVINLAGEPIADGRWTTARRLAIRNSRNHATKALVAAIQAAPRPPRVFISSSAIGIYGDRGDQPLTEQAAPGSDFLASVCVDWENAARRAASDSTRVVLIRTGLVLAGDGGGALPRLAMPFWFFVGGRLGSGRQYVSWISVEDWTGLVQWALEHDEVSGPINATAPEPVTNAEFARVLGRVIRRPAVMPTPGFALHLALGEMADAMILTGQRVLPAKAQAMGFHFRYATLEPALRAIYAGARSQLPTPKN
jgi:uncharacterized protein (TIGR01777 family)